MHSRAKRVRTTSRTRTTIIAILFLLTTVSPGLFSRPNARKTAQIVKESPEAQRTTDQVRETYGQIPLSFVANQGQTESTVNFLARGAGYTLFLKPTEAVFVLTRPQAGNPAPTETGRLSFNDPRVEPRPDKNAVLVTTPQAVLRMRVVGADAGAAVAGEDELAGKVNYFKGDDPAQWRTNVPTFKRVRYHEVYPGIDMIYYGNQRQLEYDFRIAPGSNPQTVKLKFDGADKVEVEADGVLLLTLGESVIRQPKPFVYQEIGGERRQVEGDYAVGVDGQVGFTVGAYDTSLPLVIDPVLVYSTYLGGAGDDSAYDLAVDSSGNAYICGGTFSANFPTANAFDSTFGGGTFVSNGPTPGDAFVAKLNAAGTAFVYSTYFGGSGTVDNDTCHGIAIDSTGNAYIVGETRSQDFPTVNAFQGTHGGGSAEGFLTKLNAAGSALVFSTFIGGNAFDAAHGLTVDSSGSVYVVGETSSSNFAVVNPIQANFAGGFKDAFIMKFNAAGSALVYSTYFGGNTGGIYGGFDAAYSIAVDAAGNFYVTGETTSTDFPTANAVQATYGGGGAGLGDAFIAKINAAGSALVYSTYLGGRDIETGADIAVDSSGNAHVAGVTLSTNFPLANALDTERGTISDGFVTKLNAAGSAFVYSTYLGGFLDDNCLSIALDSAGNAYVTGRTNFDFPLADPIQATGGGDAFVAKLNPAGTALMYSSFLGGSGTDGGQAIAVDSANNIYVAGVTAANNFPTLNAPQATRAGGDDAFVTKISEPSAGTVQFSAATYAINEGVIPVELTLTRAGDVSTAATVEFVTSDGTAIQRTDYTIGAGTVRWAAGDGSSKSFRLLISDDSYVEGNESFTVTLHTTFGATIGTQGKATVTITDDDTTTPATIQPIDDANIFVRQHYHDLLAREGDSGGIAYWTNEITQCGADATCIRLRRLGVSDAFFFEPEFQETFAYLYRVYKASFGSMQYADFMRDRSRVVGGVMLDAEKNAFNDAFVLRPRFRFGRPISPADYVDALNANTGNTLTTFQRDALVNGLTANTETRGSVLRKVAENSVFVDQEYNNAFVMNLYFSYLRRNPEDGGFNFWLNQINSAPLRNVAKQQALVCSFITSQEYQERFSSVVTRTNAECGP